MSLNKLSKVSTLSAEDQVALFSAGLGADSAATLATLLGWVQDNIEVLASSIASAGITDSTAVGRAVIVANDAAAARTAIGSQAQLVSGTSVKTINGQSILGGGNLTIADTGGGTVTAPWSTTWDATGNKDLGTHTITGPLALTSTATGAIVGGSTQATLIADATNVPTFDGNPATNWNATSGMEHIVLLSNVGGVLFWTVAPRVPVVLVAPTITTVPVVSSALTTGVTFAAAVASGTTPITYVYALVDGSNTLITDSVTSGFTASAGTGRKIRVTATNSAGSAVGYSASFDIAAPTLIGTAAKVAAGFIVGANIAESGSAPAGYTYTVGAGGTNGVAEAIARIRKADGTTVLAASDSIVFKSANLGGYNLIQSIGTTTKGNIAIELRPAGYVVVNNAYGAVALTGIPASGGADTWVRGADWASLASHAASTVWRASIVGNEVRVYSSLDNGAAWAHLATYDVGAAETWQINNPGATMYAVGQSVQPSVI